MLGLTWLLVAVWGASISSDHAAWESLLKSIDSTLPWYTAQNSKICYLFDLSQACSSEAAGHLLGLTSAKDFAGWTADDGECNMLLDEQRFYLEGVASTLFASAITKAAAVTDFELLAQSWVLRVGHYALVTEHQAFVTMINGITDWTTVICDGTDLLHDDLTTALPTFIGAVDCGILGNAYIVPVTIDCDNPACIADEGATCCLYVGNGPCCDAHLPQLNSDCNTVGCSIKSACCIFNPSSYCCII
jgi:hypothetical protein